MSDFNAESGVSWQRRMAADAAGMVVNGTAKTAMVGLQAGRLCCQGGAVVGTAAALASIMAATACVRAGDKLIHTADGVEEKRQAAQHRVEAWLAAEGAEADWSGVFGTVGAD